jgi:cell division septation protein DedD
MSRSYYVIELSARWLTVLLIALALLMVLAFGLGFGAARSTATTDGGSPVGPTPTPLVTTEVLPDDTPTAVVPSEPVATATPRPELPEPATPTIIPATPTAAPPTPTPRPEPTRAAEGDFWVQVIASSRRSTIDDARTTLVGLGFDREHQQVASSEVAGGGELHKLRVGPFPDRASADRVVKRMRSADFPDAWVVIP